MAVDKYERDEDGNIIKRFEIDGVPVKEPSLSYKPTVNTNGIWYRNMSGSRCGNLVSNGKTFPWVWPRLTDDEINEILGIIYAKLDVGIDTFEITSYLPGRGNVTETCYIGATLAPEEIAPCIWKYEAHWIQVEGKLTI